MRPPPSAIFAGLTKQQLGSATIFLRFAKFAGEEYPQSGLNFHVACYFHVGQKHNARLLATRGSAACARSRRRCCGTPQALAMVERMVRIGQAVRLQHIMQYRERRRAV